MRSRTVTVYDGGDRHRLRLIAQPHTDGEHIAVRVTYMGEEGGRLPLEEVTLRHQRDKCYLTDRYGGYRTAMEKVLEMWRNDIRQ